MKNKQKLVCGFMMMILTGLVFDTCNTINKYGWEYERTITIEGVEITHIVDTRTSIVFSVMFGFFTLLSIIVLWEIHQIS